MAPSGVILYSPGPGRYLEGTGVGCTAVGSTGVGGNSLGSTGVGGTSVGVGDTRVGGTV